MRQAFERRRGASTLAASLGLAMIAAAPEAHAATIKMGTVAPGGSIWHKALLELADAFSQETNGQVELKVYAGVVGDEATIVRKMRVGQLQAATLTNTGMALITQEPLAVQLPMMFESTEEVDAVMEEMAPLFDRALEDDGYHVLLWSNAGWLRFFTKRPATSVEDVKGMKMWMWAHAPNALESFADIGFQPVVLSGVDIIPSLQTGMIDALPTSAVSALAIQSYPLTPNMIDIKWGVMLGGTVISKRAWERIPADARERIQRRAKEIARKLDRDVWQESVKAMQIMQQNGLQVHTPSTGQMAEWQARAQRGWKILKGQSVDAALADRALAVRDAFRKKKQGAAPGATATANTH